jgi:hypothetical protein
MRHVQRRYWFSEDAEARLFGWLLLAIVIFVGTRGLAAMFVLMTVLLLIFALAAALRVLIALARALLPAWNA